MITHGKVYKCWEYWTNMEKLTLTKKIISEEKREFKVGNRGDLTLLESRSGKLILGLFDKIVQVKHEKYRYVLEYISLLSTPYTLEFVDFFDEVKIPSFVPYNTASSLTYNKPNKNSFRTSHLKDIAFGKEKIEEFLNEKDAGKYMLHLNLLKTYFKQ